MEDKPTSGYAKQGYFRELDGFIGADRTFKYEDYYPGLFEGLKFRGKALRAAPALADPLHLLQQGRLRPGRGQAPPADWRDGSWNWTTFIEASRKLTLRQGSETTQWGFPLSGYSWTRWRPWIWQNGGAEVSQDLKRSVLDTPEAIEGLQFYADLLNVHRVAPSPEERTAIGLPANDIDLFAQGKAAMISSAPYFPSSGHGSRTSPGTSPRPRSASAGLPPCGRTRSPCTPGFTSPLSIGGVMPDRPLPDASQWHGACTSSSSRRNSAPAILRPI